MKELDVLLEQFVAQYDQELQAGQWPEFETLLQAEDDVLWDLLQNPQSAGEAAVTSLLEQIRQAHA